MTKLDQSNVRANPREEKVKLHGPADFAAMRKAGKLAAEALDMLVPHVKPGVSTEQLDTLVLNFALDHGAIPAPSRCARAISSTST
jgi:methionyl aminopeptidase